MKLFVCIKYVYFTSILKGKKSTIYDSKKAVFLLFASFLIGLFIKETNEISVKYLLGVAILNSLFFSNKILVFRIDKCTKQLLDSIPASNFVCNLSFYIANFIYMIITFILSSLILLIVIGIYYGIKLTLIASLILFTLTLVSFNFLNLIKQLVEIFKISFLAKHLKLIALFFFVLIYVFYCKKGLDTCTIEKLVADFDKIPIILTIIFLSTLIPFSLSFFVCLSNKKTMDLKKCSLKQKHSLKSFEKELSFIDSKQTSYVYQFLEKSVFLVIMAYILFDGIPYEVDQSSLLASMGINLILSNSCTFYNLKYSQNPRTKLFLNSTIGYSDFEIKKIKMKSIHKTNICISLFISTLVLINSLNFYAFIVFCILSSLSCVFTYVFFLTGSDLLPYSSCIRQPPSKNEEKGLLFASVFAILFESILLVFGFNKIALIILTSVGVLASIPFSDFVSSNQNDLYRNFKQKKFNDCGLSALRIFLFSYDIKIDELEYKELLKSHMKSQSFYDLSEVANSYNINLVGYECKDIYKQIDFSKGPIIALMRGFLLKHYVVVHEMTEEFVIIGDPGYKNSRKISRKQFDERYTYFLLKRED